MAKFVGMLIVLFGTILIIVCNYGSVNNPVRNADKVGQISRVADEGLFCHTTTVLVTGKFGGGELTVTVPKNNAELLKKVHEFNDSQEQVKVTYHADLLESPCSNETENRMLDTIETHPEGAAK